MMKNFILKYFIAPKIVKKYSKWYIETQDWKKTDWRNWVAEEFERLKRTPWTLKNFPKLKDITFDDLPNFPITEEYKEAPEDFPAFITFNSTGTVSRKTIALSKNDMIKIASSIGRTIWLITGSAQFKNGLFMGYLGLGSGNFYSRASYILAKRSLFVPANEWRKYLEKIIKKGPYDLLAIPLPNLIDFIRHTDVDMYDD